MTISRITTWGLILAVSASVALAEELSSADKHAIAEANKFVTRANEFVSKNSLPRAKAEYQKALKIFPRHLDALYNLAVVCEKLGQDAEAIEHYQLYVQLAPNDADAWTQLGVRYDTAGKRVAARSAYDKALVANPNFGLAHHNLGVLLKEEGQFAEAEQHLQKFVKLEEEAGRQNGDAYYSLGALYLATGRIKDAKLLIQKALDTDPSVPYYNNAMGDVSLAEKQPNLAVISYNKAIEKDDKYAPAYSGLGDAQRQLGEREKASDAYNKALALRKDYHVVHFKLGLLHAETDPMLAIKDFENYLGSGKDLEFEKEAKVQIEKLKQAKQ